MKIFNVFADNDMEYEDYRDYQLLIGAETEDKAINIAKNIWNQNEYIKVVNISVEEVKTTANGIKIKTE